MKIYRGLRAALALWLTTTGIFSFFLEIMISSVEPDVLLIPSLITFIVSFPVFPVLAVFFIARRNCSSVLRGAEWLCGILVFLSSIYGILAALTGIPVSIFLKEADEVLQGLIISLFLLLSSGVSWALWRALVNKAIAPSHESTVPASHKIFIHSINSTVMEQQAFNTTSVQPVSNRIFFKGLITGAMILLMLIPTIFISNLVKEREARRKDVVREVSAKWASDQTVAPPFLVVNYVESALNADGKPVTVTRPLILLPQKLESKGKIFPETRSRSIYDILLYRSDLNFSGNFKPEWPDDIDPAAIDYSTAKVCFGLNDFKGIEEDVMITFNKERLKMRPGKTVTDFHQNSLYSPVQIDAARLNEGIPFSMNIQLRGSGKLHFLPLAASGSFLLESPWPNPSFDGNRLPAARKVSDTGFTARWNFNEANLAFSSVINSGSYNFSNESFGLSMVQPADQYDKTERSVKYAILVIGLTFGLFFIMELTSSNPFHPVQYVLVGMALVIFYTLLLSISEFINFDYAYLLAASAIVILVTWYAKSHFGSWRSATIFATMLTMLYGFIFILLRLEDTALLAGSIGLFAILALVMYASRKVNWYGSPKIAPSV